MAVMRKHRLAERLLLDVIGLDWQDVHVEACRWEHVMSEQVEQRLVDTARAPADCRPTATRSRVSTTSGCHRPPVTETHRRPDRRRRSRRGAAAATRCAGSSRSCRTSRVVMERAAPRAGSCPGAVLEFATDGSRLIGHRRRHQPTELSADIAHGIHVKVT